MPYSLLLLDYDGTLCDTRQAIAYSLGRTFEAHGRPAPLPAALTAVIRRGLPLLETLRALAPAADPALITPDWVTTYRAVYVVEAEALVRPFAGAETVLAAAQARSVPVVVLSNKGAQVLENSLVRLGFRAYVGLLLGDGSFPGRPLPLKPDPAQFTEIIRPRFPNISLPDILMVGDAPPDLLFARNCGIAAGWARYGFGEPAVCRALRPAHEFGSLAEVLPLLAG